MLLNTESCREMADFYTDKNSFQVLLCTSGCGLLLYGGSGVLQFFKGIVYLYPLVRCRSRFMVVRRC